VLIGEVADADMVSVLIANSKSRIGLYVNGRLWDEDWPLGSVPLDGCVCTECTATVTIGDDVFG